MENLPAAAPRQPPWAWNEIIAWAVIMLTAGIFFSAAAAKSESAAENPELKLVAKTLVGMRQLLPNNSSKSTLQQLGQDVQNPQDAIDVAIVYGEMENAAAAEERLTEIVPDDPQLQKTVDLLQRYYRGQPFSAADAQRLRKQFGWFGDLALSYGKLSTDPLRRATLDAATRAAEASIAAEAVIALAALVALALIITAIVLLVLNKIQLAFSRLLLPENRGSYVEAVAIYLAATLLLSLMGAVLGLSTMKREALLPLAFLPALFWPHLRGQSWQQWQSVLGLHRGCGIFREFLMGIAGYLAGIPLIAGGVILSNYLIQRTGANASHPISQQLGGGFWPVAEAFLLASLYAPFAEELMFRGALLGHLRQRYPWWIAAPAVSLIFAAIHPQGWTTIPALASVALVLAAIREWRGTTLGCMAAHCLHNTAALAFALLTTS